MADLGSKAGVAAVYEEIDQELRRRRWQVIGASVAAALLSIAMVAYFWGTLPTGPVTRRSGTVIRTMQVADDEAHDVRLVVTLDRGPSVILLPPSGLVPIGARVIVGERKNHFGWSTYAFVGRESESNGQ